MLIKDVVYRAQQRKILKCVRTARAVFHFDETLLLMLVKKHPERTNFVFFCCCFSCGFSFYLFIFFCYKLMLIIRLIPAESKVGAMMKARVVLVSVRVRMAQ